MTAITIVSPAAFAENVLRGLREFMRVLGHRLDAAPLAKLDDRLLADIGLVRSDLRDAFSRPLWRDPTAVLASRVGRRGGAYR
jgi:uncharacterized protein YjiS (DUF1127 family)